MESFLRPPFSGPSRSICDLAGKAIELTRRAQARCFEAECDDHENLAKSGLQDAIYCQVFKTPGVRYGEVLKAAEGAIGGCWTAKNGPNPKNTDSLPGKQSVIGRGDHLSRLG